MAEKEPKQVIKKPYRNNIMQTMGARLDEGDNTKFLSLNLRLFNLPKIDLHDSEAVQERISEYFQIYAEADVKPTVAGMGIALGLDRRRLWEIANNQTKGRGDIDTLPDATRDYVKNAYKILENLWENYMSSGKINPVSGIFLGKNNFGYQDKTEYVVTPNTQQEDSFNADDFRKRYLPAADVVEGDE